MILSGWPDTKEDVPIAIRSYWNVKNTLTIQNGIIYHSGRVVIPKALRPALLRRTHSRHLGNEASLRKAHNSLYWPLINEEIKDFVRQCRTCSRLQRKQQKEPLMMHDIPEHSESTFFPWSLMTSSLQLTIIQISLSLTFFQIRHQPQSSTVWNNILRAMELRKLLLQITAPS